MFWYDKPKILFERQNYTKFFPTAKMDTVEKLNAIMRLSIYLGLTLVLATNKYTYFYIPIVVALFTVAIFKFTYEHVESFFNQYNATTIQQGKCVQPTFDNPFMNANLITGNRHRAPACLQTTAVKKEIKNKYNNNLYRNVGDIFGKANGQRQFYTMPSTTFPNSQTKFAKWLYGTGPTCKQQSKMCATPWEGLNPI